MVPAGVHGKYTSTRRPETCQVDPRRGYPSASGRPCHSWMDVGVTALENLAKWVSDLDHDPPELSKFCWQGACAKVISGIEIVNEPALYEEMAHLPGIQLFANRTIPNIRRTLGPEIDIVVSYTGDNAKEFAGFLRSTSPMWGVGLIILDFHQYYTWDHGVAGPGYDTVTWDEAIAEVPKGQWNQLAPAYTGSGLQPVIGEWSIAINGDQVALPHWQENNLFDGQLHGSGRATGDNREAMRRYYVAQKCNWMKTAEGDFYWSLRMGSGHEPRRCGKPELDADKALSAGTDKCQVSQDGVLSSHRHSLPRYRFRSWNLLELIAELGIDSVEVACDTLIV